MGWWPRPTDITVDVVKHENLSAFIILLLIVAAVEFYIVKIAVTLRRQGELHRALEAEQQEHVELLSRLISAKDEERQELAYALHEGPVQELLALRYGVYNDMKPEQLIEIIETATTKLRDLSRALHPSDLEHYGLSYALRQLVEGQAEEGTISIEASLPEKVCADNKVARVLYRIAQEALNNVRYHSGARHAWLNLDEDNDTIALEIRDDGHGFDVESARRRAVDTRHFGLAMLYELASSVNGDLKILSKPGEGTTVRVSVPVVRPAEENIVETTE